MISNPAARILASAGAAILACGIGGLFSASLQPAAHAAPAAKSTAPDPGKALFTDKCAACHNIPVPQELLYTRRQWRATVDEMLYQHGALYSQQNQAGITTDQADQIVDYLAQFAPKPGSFGRMDPTQTLPSDVWLAAPLQSRAFPFTADDELDSFSASGGVWKIVPSPNIGEGYLKCRPAPGQSHASLLVENKDSITADLDLRVSFKLFQPTEAPAVGILAAYQDPRNYSAVVCDPALQTLSLLVVSDGQAQILPATDLPSVPVASPADGWHTLRVIVHNNGSVSAWLDYQKRLVTSLPGWKPGGQTGLWSSAQDVAAFRTMTVDIYPPINSPAAPSL